MAAHPGQPDPWKSPSSELREPAKPRVSQKGTWLVSIGVAWQSAILVGIVDFAFKVVGFYRMMQETGLSDPKLMAAGIWTALIPVFLWGLAGAPGLFLTAVAVLRSEYRPRWLFWSSVGFSLLYLLIVPLGTLGAITLLIALLATRREFFAPAGLTRATRAAPRA